jgi:hypothetical protein
VSLLAFNVGKAKSMSEDEFSNDPQITLSTAWLEMQAGVQPDWEKAREYLNALTEEEAQKYLCQGFNLEPKDFDFTPLGETEPDIVSQTSTALSWLDEVLCDVQTAWEIDEPAGMVRYDGKFASFLLAATEQLEGEGMAGVEIIIAFEVSGLAEAAGFAMPDDSGDEEEDIN